MSSPILDAIASVALPRQLQIFTLSVSLDPYGAVVDHGMLLLISQPQEPERQRDREPESQKARDPERPLRKITENT